MMRASCTHAVHGCTHGILMHAAHLLHASCVYVAKHAAHVLHACCMCLGCIMQTKKCGGAVAYGLWPVACGRVTESPVACGMWHVAYGRWPMAADEEVWRCRSRLQVRVVELEVCRRQRLPDTEDEEPQDHEGGQCVRKAMPKDQG